ncbi:hypothetical protein HMI55_006713 [Coelomomyces lativittatus]|nr:hypothetical protein HMI55_006713 [Coelomomyces lativittatus]
MPLVKFRKILRSFILEAAIDVLAKFPILTNAVLCAELDFNWHFVKERRHLDLQDTISIPFIKKGFENEVDKFLTASVTEWNGEEGYAVLNQENENLNQYLMPSQLSFCSKYFSEIKMITCVPKKFYRPLLSLLPTPLIVFHCSTMIKDIHLFWFSILHVNEFHDGRCITILRPINTSSTSSTVRVLCKYKLIFRFLQLKTIIGISHFKQLDDSLVECTDESIYFVRIENDGDPDIGNKPVKVSGNSLDRFAVKVSDGSGVVDITAWGLVAREFSKLYSGQVVFFSNLTSSEKSPEKKFFIKAQPEYNAKVTVVSSLHAFLKSEAVLNISSLASIQSPTFVVSDVNVISYSPPPYYKLAHCECQKPLNLEHTVWSCPVCKVEIFPGALDQTTMIYTISWNISDKSCFLACGALNSASSALIGISAGEFSGLTLENQSRLLENVLKSQYRVGIVSILESKKKPSSLRFRLDIAMKLSHN